jgi:hypothetical protein
LTAPLTSNPERMNATSDVTSAPGSLKRACRRQDRFDHAESSSDRSQKPAPEIDARHQIAVGPSTRTFGSVTSSPPRCRGGIGGLAARLMPGVPDRQQQGRRQNRHFRLGYT